MAIKSGITLTETDPANIPTPSTGKITIFQDATVSPPAPAYKDDSDVVTSLTGPVGPAGPAGPSGSITVNPNGALDGDGSGGAPLSVLVDGVTIGINASNELEALGAGSGTVINDATLTSGQTVVGNGGAHVTVSALTGDLVDSATGTLGAVSVGAGLLKSGGILTAHVDNETIGIDSNNKLEVIQNYAVADGILTQDSLMIGQGGHHLKALTTALSESKGGTGQSTYTKGDLLASPGTTLNKLGVGADGQVLTADAASTNGMKWVAPSGTSVVVQVVNTSYTTKATGTTAIPHDDTIPQITEGNEYFTAAITPTSDTNKLRIDVVVYLSGSGASQWSAAALFQDASANALAAGTVFDATATAIQCITFTHYMTAGTTSSTTFRVRAGYDGGATTTVNGQAGNRVFGGVLTSSITITEIVP